MKERTKMKELELLKEARKMCEAQINCASCELHEDCFFTRRPRFITDAMIEEYCSKIEKWSKAHQPITNAQKFEEVFCPGSYCMINRADQFWNKPYKEPKGGGDNG